MSSLLWIKLGLCLGLASTLGTWLLLGYLLHRMDERAEERDRVINTIAWSLRGLETRINKLNKYRSNKNNV